MHPCTRCHVDRQFATDLGRLVHLEVGENDDFKNLLKHRGDCDYTMAAEQPCPAF